ncbi:hypothetical protein HpEKB20_01150 [Helicobacter pylori]|uniref:hypothetical protein n=1 Tax=Helicobacter pylori TaxID=210 RepID=UPI00112CD85D|nr:hypothetical protein [Helicobacter pylori]TPI00868.1 hypothetical protein FIM37_01455 [Helicobacter pylori]GHP26072.1 hypothetical protein VN0211_03850 [Helicobacter pylori]
MKIKAIVMALLASGGLLLANGDQGLSSQTDASFEEMLTKMDLELNEKNFKGLAADILAISHVVGLLKSKYAEQNQRINELEAELIRTEMELHRLKKAKK